MFSFLHKKFVRYATAFSLGGGAALVLGQRAFAGNVLDISGSVVIGILSTLMEGIAYVFRWMAGTVFTFGGFLLNWGIQLNEHLLAPGTIVTTGFKIALDIANLGFVLVIIIIAVATIVRWENYSYKSLLGKLIIAAVLVNFSFAIAGVVIDFTNIIAKFFLDNAAGGDWHTISTNLATALSPQNITIAFQNPEFIQSVSTNGKSFQQLTVLGASLFSVIFTMVLAISMVAVAMMVFVRYLFLTFLLITMPLAWLTYVVPDMQSVWSGWWKTFWRWCFFLPIASFFIYLSIVMVTNQTDLANGPMATIAREAQTGAVKSTDNFGGDKFLVVMGRMVAVLGILFGGLYAASTFSITGANMAMSAAKGAANWGLRGGPGRWVGKGVYKGVGGYGGETAVKKTARGLGDLLSSKAIRWFPGAKNASANLTAFGARADEVKSFEDRLHKMAPDQVHAMLSETPPINPAEATALFKHAVENKNLEEIPKEYLAKYIDKAKAVNPGQDVQKVDFVKKALKANPHRAVEMLKLTPDSMEAKEVFDKYTRALTSEEAKDISKEALQNADVARRLGKSAIGSIIRTSDEKADVLKGTLKEIVKNQNDEFEKASKEVETTIEALKGAKRSGDQNRIQIAEAAKKDAEKAMNDKFAQVDEDVAEAWKKLQYIEQIPGNQGFN